MENWCRVRNLRADSIQSILAGLAASFFSVEEAASRELKGNEILVIESNLP